MKKALFICLLILCVVPVGSCGEKTDEPIKVSIIQLIADPEQYQGKVVEVSGVVEIIFEGSSVYLNREGWYNIAEEKIGLSIKDKIEENELRWQINDEWYSHIDAARKFNGRYATIIGRYDKTDNYFRYGSITVSELYLNPSYQKRDYYFDPDDPYYMPEIADERF